MAHHPHEVGTAMCEAFGLNPKDVKRITFDWTWETVGAVTVELHVTDASAMATVLKRYELVEKDDGKDI